METINRVVSALMAGCETSSLHSIKRPQAILWLFTTIVLARTIRRMIFNAFFHPLARIPGNKLVASTYYFVGASTLSGRSHYGIPLAHKMYGKVVRVAPEIVSVADKDMIREVLVTGDYPKSILHEGLELNEQHNLFSSRNKNFHKNRRRLVAPAFGLQYLRSLEPVMHTCIRSLITKIDELLENPKMVKSKNKVLPKGHIDMCSLLMRTAMDVIGETAFGQSFKMIEDETHPVPHQMAKTLKRSMQQTFNPWMKYLLPLDLSLADFGEERVRVRKEAEESDRRSDLLQYLIDAQQHERDEGNGETGNEYEDMISGKLTDKAVVTETCVFLIAGSETSSTAMTFTLMFLVKNPDKLAKLREEIDLATASNDKGAIPAYDQLRNLPYLTGCINESLRLRPVAATVILAQTPQLHLSEEYYPQAKKFIPERWIPGESPFPPVEDFTFYPFSAGTRNCVGKNFAMMEMRLILATLVLNYNLEIVSGQREDYVQYITTALATGKYVIKMKRR
ncbi:hypothetical protein BGW38_000007 [Lunasporangiospora selenospora]|uniref:Cytochrome P450 n=1 Tax=Lunasporangiospora selenospora TaxID=979761 RepID=A0A9P6G4J7_9FUNG|nr:hypothetical protein BGW38_000007 [Lunasporangiospora selenospora]